MKVALFATCLADQLFPDVAVASVRLLRRAGVDVAFPERQTCCGQPAHNAGHAREARRLARHHLDAFEGFDAVVAPSGSCAAMLRHYPELFEEAPEDHARARDLAGRTWELTSFLVDRLRVLDVGADLSGTTVTYHDSCHALRMLGLGAQPRALLRAAGAELREAEGADACCGFGGLFSVKMPEVSAAMARAKHPGILATGARVLTSVDGGCLMQLRGSLRRAGAGAGGQIEVLHVAELLQRGVEAAGRGRAGTARAGGAGSDRARPGVGEAGGAA